MLFFKTKKPILNEKRNESQDNVDLQIINKMNQEFAISLDLKETLNTALQIIITRLNAQAANVFLINNKTKKFECIASLNQEHLDEYQLDLKDGVMGRAVDQRKCIRVGNVRKDVREIAEFYFDLDNKTNFTTYSVLCAPLIAANDCIGVIHCLNKKTDEKLFIEDDRKLLELLSTPAALAIRNAKKKQIEDLKNKLFPSGALQERRDNFLNFAADGNYKSFIRLIYDNLDPFEKDLIVQALNRTDGNVSQTARLLNLQRTTLIEKLNKYDLRQGSLPVNASLANEAQVKIDDLTNLKN